MCHPIKSLHMESNPDLDKIMSWKEPFNLFDKELNLQEYILSTRIFQFLNNDRDIPSLYEILYDAFIEPEHANEISKMEYERNTHKEPKVLWIYSNIEVQQHISMYDFGIKI